MTRVAPEDLDLHAPPLVEDEREELLGVARAVADLAGHRALQRHRRGSGWRRWGAGNRVVPAARGKSSDRAESGFFRRGGWHGIDRTAARRAILERKELGDVTCWT